MEKVKIVIKETKDSLNIETHGEPTRILAALTIALTAKINECKKVERTKEAATRTEEVALVQLEQAVKELENVQQ